MYFNHPSHISRKRWNKLMKITNGNQTKPHNNNKKVKEKLYHKVVIWNKQSSYLASDNEGFPVFKRAILKHDPNLVIITEDNLSNAKLANVESEFEGYDIHHTLTWALPKSLS